MSRTVYKHNGVVYITDNAGTWIVNKGNAPNPYSIFIEKDMDCHRQYVQVR